MRKEIKDAIDSGASITLILIVIVIFLHKFLSVRKGNGTKISLRMEMWWISYTQLNSPNTSEICVDIFTVLSTQPVQQCQNTNCLRRQRKLYCKRKVEENPVDD